MFTHWINDWFEDITISETGDNNFSFSSAWGNLNSAFGFNKTNDPVRIDIRLAFGDVIKENLVDFIDYNWLISESGKQVSEYIIVYLGLFKEKIANNIVNENFLIDKTCKKVRHFYFDLASDENLSELIKGNYLSDFNRIRMISREEITRVADFENKKFGLWTKGIKKENLPGNPLISIIIPAFNSESVIEQAIQSAIVQTYQNKEIIVVDGGSKDSTATIVKKYEDQIDWFNSEPDKNIFDAINKGTYLSNGRYSVFFGSDDLLVYNALEKVAESIADQGEKDFIFGNGIILTEHGLIKKCNCFLRGKKSSQFRIYHPALYIRKDIFIELNGFNIDYFISADADFELKLITLKKTFFKTDNFLCIYRGGGHSSRFFSVKIKQVHTIYKKYNAFDLSYYLGLIRLILLTGIKRLLGDRVYNLFSVYKYPIKR